MKPVSERLLKRLAFAQAVDDEADSVRNLIPDEPGWQTLKTQSSSLAKYVENLLRSGYLPALQQETLARKPSLGVRPISYWGAVERIVYRSLAVVAMGPVKRADRSAEAYVKFMRAPVDRAWELKKAEAGTQASTAQTLSAFSMDVPLKYIVKGDISAFYQFVDHELLLDELVNQGGDAEAVHALGQLLLEVQGRRFGLPQLLEPSDWLSDVAIDRVERQLHRSGLEVWRFNDDFRIGCRSYQDSLQAVERLDAAARANGFVLNEHKTLTYSFLKYMLESYDATPETTTEIIAQDDVEVLVGDYTDTFEDDPDAAVAVLTKASPKTAEGEGVNLRHARVDEVRLLMRALNGLAKAGDPRSVDRSPELMSYVPSLTPALCRYLTHSHAHDAVGVAAALDEIRKLSLGEWQKVWVLDTYRALDLLEQPNENASSSPRVNWAAAQRLEARTPIVRAAATRALAHARRLNVSEVVADSQENPDALLLYYAAAALDAASASSSSQDASALTAFKAESLLHKMACYQPAPTSTDQDESPKTA